MTGTAEGYAAEPGWYPDPAGLPQHRWWDGYRWTEHVYGAPTVPAPEPIPGVAPGTPVYNVYIWAVTVLPVLTLIPLLLIDMRQYVIRMMSGSVGFLDTAWVAVAVIGWAVALVNIVLALLDWRKLKRDGYVRPFHWAWAVLANAAYVIGRSVVVKRRAGRGLIPIWVWAVTAVLTLVVIVLKLAEIFSGLMVTIPNSVVA